MNTRSIQAALVLCLANSFAHAQPTAVEAVQQLVDRGAGFLAATRAAYTIWDGEQCYTGSMNVWSVQRNMQWCPACARIPYRTLAGGAPAASCWDDASPAGSAGISLGWPMRPFCLGAITVQSEQGHMRTFVLPLHMTVQVLTRNEPLTHYRLIAPPDHGTAIMLDLRCYTID